MGKAEYKVEGGKMIRVYLTKKNDVIEEVKITGDFFLHPEVFIEELEEALRGFALNEPGLTELIKSLSAKRDATFLGVSPQDVARCIMMAGAKDD